MKTLHFDCFAGASGNMILGGLVSLGIDQQQLIERIRLLNISNFEIEFATANKSGIAAIHANVKVLKENVHRHLHTIVRIIEDSRLSDKIKERSIKIFTKLGEVEAKIHGTEIEKVHFHEVGAMDAIIDIVGACIGFEMLGIDRFTCSKIHVGSGFVNIAHGKYPVPPPAVAELLKGIPTYSNEIVGELCTPTGAAIISTLCESYSETNELNVENIGYGAGTREYDNFPNVIRLLVGESQGKLPLNETLSLIETNLDDTTPQILAYVMEKALQLGALDCWFTSIQMKKNRPATMISILCNPEDQQKLSELLYLETTTLGLRIHEIKRESLDREILKVKTQFGEIDVKIGLLNGKRVNAMPEFEQLKRIANETGVSLKLLKEEVLRKLNEQ